MENARFRLVLESERHILDEDIYNSGQSAALLLGTIHRLNSQVPVRLYKGN